MEFKRLWAGTTAARALAAVLVMLVALASGAARGLQAQEDRPPRPVEQIEFDLPYLNPAVAGLAATPSHPGGESQLGPDQYSFPPGMGWTRLAFQSYRDLNDWEIYVVNGDGSGEMPLTDNDDSDIHPRLNRAATHVLFASNRGGDYEIVRKAIDGSELTRLTRNEQDDVQPAWSPDGSKIAFQSYRDGQAEIYVMNADGSGQTRLTAHPDYDGEPAWSPDGNRIAFTSRRTGGYRIWVMNADGSGAVQLSTQPYSENPTWSPDGRNIAFDADGDGDGWQELWLIHTDGSLEYEIYDPGYRVDAWARSWSPDGRYLAFTRIVFIEYKGNWYWTDAYLYAWDIVPWFLGLAFSLGGGELEWRPDWQSLDVPAPSSQVNALPAESPSPFRVSWTGSDSGSVSLENIEIQVRDGADGLWLPWYVDYKEYEAMYEGTAGHTYYFRSRAIDTAGVHEPWPLDYDAVTTVEARPPQTAVDPLPEFSRGQIEVTWGGWDPGGTGIATYDLQTRELPVGSWTDWLTGTTQISATFSGTPGHTYQFRSRARDGAHNLEAWPPGDGDASTTFYDWAMSGTVRDNTGAPVAGAAVNTTPQALNAVTSGLDGAYQAYLVAAGSTFTTTWAKAEYGTLPPTTFPATRDGHLEAFLPPADNLVLNWGFESGNLGPADWLASGPISPTVIAAPRHTGQYAAVLGQSHTLAQVANVSHASDWLNGHQMYMDEGGTIHTVWSESGLNYARWSSDGGWSSPESIGGNGDFPQLAVDGNGNVHVVWTEYPAILYARRSPDGSWSNPLELSNIEQAVSHPRIVLGPDGSLHVGWEAGIDELGSLLQDFYRRRASDGTWSSIENVSAPFEQACCLTRTPGDSTAPQVALGDDGALHVTWLERTPEIQDLYHGMLPPLSAGHESSIAQVVTIPGSMETPVLSFLYQLGGASPEAGTHFRVGLEDGVSATTLFTTTTNTADWTHRWFDLAPWAGQTVTLTFSVLEATGLPTAWAYLDEVSLGSGHADAWVAKESGLPSARPGEQATFALTYGNRGGLPASGVLVSDTLPAHLSLIEARPAPDRTSPALVWDVGDLAAGSGAFTILVTATVSQTAPMMKVLTNTARIETTTPELETLNNLARAGVFVGRRVYLPTVMRQH